jgi:trimeric autotransporter adhesin
MVHSDRSLAILLSSSFAVFAWPGHAASGGEVCAPTWDTLIGIPGIDEGYVAGFGVYDDGLGGGPALYATGSFDSAGGGVVGTGNFAKWNGTAWQAVGGGLDTSQFTNTMTVHNGELYVGGYFSLAGGVPGTAKLAKWNGVQWSGLNAQLDQFDDSVWALKSHDDGSGHALYVGGNYQDIGGTKLDFIARWNGSSFTEVGGTIAGAVPLIVLCLEEFNGDLYAGGRFTSIDGVPAFNIARWDGTQWHALGGGITHTGTAQVISMTAFDDGTGEALYVAGTFTTAGGVPASRIAKWNGTSWSALGPGFVSGNVNALAVYNDGTGDAVYATGGFTTSGVTTVNRLAKWDGATWTMVGTGLNNNTGFALTTFDDGDGEALFIGGSFTSANSTAVNRVVRYVGCPVGVPGDIAPPGTPPGDGVVNVQDLLAVISAWGACPQPCPPSCLADLAPPGGGDCAVNVQDLLFVIANWG